MEQDNQQNTKKKKFSKILPVWKFILLSIVTFGIYEFVWFYKNWKLLKEKMGLKISPFWHAVLSPILAWSIAENIKKYLKEKNIPCNYSSIIIGISYLIISMSWKLPAPYWLLWFFTFIPMLPLVNSMNIYWQKEEKNLPLKNFTWWQIILVILGIILVMLSIMGTFMPE